VSSREQYKWGENYGLDDCLEVYEKVAVGETDTAVARLKILCARKKRPIPPPSQPHRPKSNKKLIVTFCNGLHLNPRSTSKIEAHWG
jgi:hypothetical protein